MGLMNHGAGEGVGRGGSSPSRACSDTTDSLASCLRPSAQSLPGAGELRVCRELVNNLLQVSVSPEARLCGSRDGRQAILPSCQWPYQIP